MGLASLSTRNMSPKSRLDKFAEQVGFTVEVASDAIRAIRVPCLFRGGVVGTCTIEASYDSATSKPNNRTGGDVHAVRISIDGEYDGRVYHADGSPIGNRVGGDDKTWSNISIKLGTRGHPKRDKTAQDLVHRYVKHIVGAVAAAGYYDPTALSIPDPFHIPNTFEARADIAPVQDRIRGQRIAIIGLGGTGAYLLDLLSKTPVAEIHLLDSDRVDWHTLKRAPGAPTAEEIELVREGSLLKVDYYHSKYAPFRHGIHPHPVKVDNPSMFTEFLTDHPVDYAFVCIDQMTEGDSARQDVVYHSVAEAGIPFIDSGVSITLEGSAVTGSVTTSAYDAGSDAWQNAIPNAKLKGSAPGYRNVQLPEVNAAAATFAVMEWRRRTGQYASESPSFLQKFLLEKARISYAK